MHAALGTLPQGPAVDVYAMVVMGIEQDERDSYRAAAERIEASGANLVRVQHEYGILGFFPVACA